jgi:hypothetical protein
MSRWVEMPETNPTSKSARRHEIESECTNKNANERREVLVQRSNRPT